jgi:hypothetical protein
MHQPAQQSRTHTCAYTTNCEACRLPTFHTVYEVIDGSDLTPHYGKRSGCPTVSEAAQNLGPADYVVVNGWMRELTSADELEYKAARRATWQKASKTA